MRRDGVGGDAGARYMRAKINGGQKLGDRIEGSGIQRTPHAGAHRS